MLDTASRAKYLSTSQAGRVLDLSSERVRQLADAGRLPFVETPLGRLLPEDAVRALAVERSEKRAAGAEGDRS